MAASAVGTAVGDELKSTAGLGGGDTVSPDRSTSKPLTFQCGGQEDWMEGRCAMNSTYCATLGKFLKSAPYRCALSSIGAARQGAD